MVIRPQPDPQLAARQNALWRSADAGKPRASAGTSAAPDSISYLEQPALLPAAERAESRWQSRPLWGKLDGRPLLSRTHSRQQGRLHFGDILLLLASNVPAHAHQQHLAVSPCHISLPGCLLRQMLRADGSPGPRWELEYHLLSFTASVGSKADCV